MSKIVSFLSSEAMADNTARLVLENRAMPATQKMIDGLILWADLLGKKERALSLLEMVRVASGAGGVKVGHIFWIVEGTQNETPVDQMTVPGF